MLQRILFFTVATLAGISLLTATPEMPVEGQIHVLVQRQYGSWDNPLHSEFSINGTTVNIYTSDTFEAISQYLKPGWNTLTLKTTPQEPAASGNGLIFRIGPMRKDPKRNQMTMDPVLWEFRNDTDWKLNEGRYSHPLGPDVKEVVLTYRVYFAGLELENKPLKAGDFILRGKPSYGSWNSPVIATVFVNGTPLNTFILQERSVVISSLLKPGKNEIKLVSARVKNSISGNDINLEVAGPAEWFVDQNRYMLKPVLEFKTMPGWTKNAKSGQLINQAQPDADTLERVIPFMLKEAPKPSAP